MVTVMVAERNEPEPEVYINHVVPLDTGPLILAAAAEMNVTAIVETVVP